MNYGDIIGGSFSVIWREKKLWLFGIVGLALSSMGTGLYMSSIFNWQSNIMSMVTDPVLLDNAAPEEVFSTIFSGMGWMMGGIGLMSCLTLAGYILNLFMRGGTISEAGRAWTGEETDFSRGTHTGFSRSLYILAIDFLWWLPGLLIGLCAFLTGMAVLGSTIAAATSGSPPDDASVVFSMLGSIFTVITCLACIGFLIAIARGIFAPLMYQSVVQGRKSLGQGIAEGWNLAKSNIGPMIVFFIIAIAVQLVIGLLIQLGTLPMMAVWMTSWAGSISSLAEGGSFAAPSIFSSGLMVLAGLLMGAISLLVYGFGQSYMLTMYAQVYRDLTPAPVISETPAIESTAAGATLEVDTATEATPEDDSNSQPES